MDQREINALREELEEVTEELEGISLELSRRYRTIKDSVLAGLRVVAVSLVSYYGIKTGTRIFRTVLNMLWRHKLTFSMSMLLALSAIGYSYVRADV